MRKPFSLVVSILAVAAPQLAFGFGAGVTGYSGKTANMVCNNCHSGGPVPTVKITGPATLAPGQVGTYSADATVTAGGRLTFVGGLDIATDDANAVLGTAAATTKVLNGELTHTQGLPYTKVAGGTFTLSVPFTLRAPATAGTVTLYMDMLAGAGQAAAQPDYGTAITFKINVGGTPVDGGAGGVDGGKVVDGGAAKDGGGGSTDGGATGGGSDGGVIAGDDAGAGGGGGGGGSGGGGGGAGGGLPNPSPSPDSGSGSGGCTMAPASVDGACLLGLALAGVLLLLLARRRRA